MGFGDLRDFRVLWLIWPDRAAAVSPGDIPFGLIGGAHLRDCDFAPKFEAASKEGPCSNTEMAARCLLIEGAILRPVRLALNLGYSPVKLPRIQQMVRENEESLMEKWNANFGN